MLYSTPLRFGVILKIMNEQEKQQLKETAAVILNGLLASGDFTGEKSVKSGYDYPKGVRVVHDDAIGIAVDVAIKLQAECDKRASSASG